MNTQSITLDVSKKPAIMPILRIGQGDKNGTTIEATIYDNGSPLSLSGYSVRFEMRLPDGTSYYQSPNGTISGNVATIPIDETYAGAVDGITKVAYIVVYSNSVVCSTSRINVIVLESAEEGADAAHAYSSGIIEATQAANDAAASATSAAGSATTAAANADAKAGLADDAASAANAAATSANAAATAAESAADAATEAMGDIPRLVGNVGSDTVQTVTDAWPAPPSNAKILGEAEQDTTTGKNLLLNYNAVGSTTVNGITYTTNADGSVTINGTATAESRLYIVRRQDQESAELASIINGGGQLTLSTSTPTLTGVRLEIAYWLGSAYAGRVTNVINGATSTTFSAPDVSFDQITAYFMIANGITVSNITFYPQLEAGSTATAYEPYTGGKPSPSPEYPQEVRVAKGRNLLPSTATTQTINGVTFTVNEDGSVTVAGTASAAIEYDILPYNAGGYFTLQPGTYRLSGCPSGGSGTTYKFDVNLDGSYSTDYGSGLTINLTTTRTVIRSRIVVYNGATINATFYPQLEAGSTATPYVPYGHVGLEVKGKNLLLNDNVSGTTNGITFTLNDDGSVTVNGTATAETRFYLIRATTPERFAIAEAIKNGASFTMSTMTTMPTRAKLELAYYQDNTYAGKINNVASGASSTTFSAPSVNFDNVRVYILVNNGATINNVTFYPQLEEGSIATPYAKYIDTTIPVPIPSDGLAALPDGTHDTLEIDSAGHVVVEKRVGVTTLSNDLTVNAFANVGTYSRAIFRNAAIPASKTNAAYGYCSHSPFADGWNEDKLHVYTDGTNIVTTAIASTVEELKSLYIGAKVYYPLATSPTIDLGYIDLPELVSICDIALYATLDAYWEVEYTKDPNAIIGRLESSIAPTEGETASANYAVGSYLMQSGTLYRVTTAIARGEAITPGGNVTATTVMAEIIRLTA